MIEVRWHGRGGQGAKTASQLLALAALKAGQYAQAFPEYGPERSGAPIQAYTRSDQRPIRRRCGVTGPDVVVVLDPSLLDEVDVAGGLKAGGLLLVNTEESPGQVRVRARFPGQIVCCPASRLAAGAGTAFPGVVLLGALAAERGEPPLETEQSALRELLGAKLAPAGLEAALAALAAGYREVVGARPQHAVAYA